MGGRWAGAKRALRLPRAAAVTYLVLALCKLDGGFQEAVTLLLGGRRVLRMETKKSACSHCALQGAPCCSFETACVYAKGKF